MRTQVIQSVQVVQFTQTAELMGHTVTSTFYQKTVKTSYVGGVDPVEPLIDMVREIGILPVEREEKDFFDGDLSYLEDEEYGGCEYHSRPLDGEEVSL